MRFAINLFAVPALALCISFLLQDAADKMSALTHLIQVAPYLNHAGGAWVLIAIVSLLWSSWRVYRACQGSDTTACEHCGMPTSHKQGRYGPYFKCWNCGLNRADRG